MKEINETKFKESLLKAVERPENAAGLSFFDGLERVQSPDLEGIFANADSQMLKKQDEAGGAAPERRWNDVAEGNASGRRGGAAAEGAVSSGHRRRTTNVRKRRWYNMGIVASAACILLLSISLLTSGIQLDMDALSPASSAGETPGMSDSVGEGSAGLGSTETNTTDDADADKEGTDGAGVDNAVVDGGNTTSGGALGVTPGSISEGESGMPVPEQNFDPEKSNIPIDTPAEGSSDSYGVPPMLANPETPELPSIPRATSFFAQPLTAGIGLLLIGLLFCLILFLASKNTDGRFHRIYAAIPARAALILCAAVPAIFGVLFLIVFWGLK